MGARHHGSAVEHARSIAARVARRGALGVALVGSVATGEDHADSDLDLVAIASQSRDLELFSDEGRLVSLSWLTVEEARASFYRPGEAGTTVPGWRAALALFDPEHAVARLRQEALAWEWESIEAGCDGWVAWRVTGLAEEVHKVAGLLRAGRPRGAAANRALLALQLAGGMAVLRRVLYGTENRLWDLVAETEGPKWACAQDAALGLDPAPSHHDGCLAALHLYRLAAHRIRHVLDEGQREVVDHAVAVADAADPGPGRGP